METTRWRSTAIAEPIERAMRVWDAEFLAMNEARLFN